MRRVTMILLATFIGQPAHAGRLDVLEPSTGMAWSTGSDNGLSSAPWWETLDDPLLVDAVQSGLGDNLELHSAWARVVQARALALQAASPLLPSLSFDTTWSTQPLDTFGFQFQASDPSAAGAAGAPSTPPTGSTIPTTTSTGGTPPTAAPAGAPSSAQGQAEEPPELFHTGQGALNARWQLDLFGRNTLAWRASHLEARAGEGDRDAQAIAVTTLIAEAYFDVVVSRQRVAVLEAQRVAQQELLDLLTLRFESGSATGLDVLQQRQVLASTEAALPPTRSALRARELQLATLVGRMPAERPDVAPGLPAPSPLPPLGRPADLTDHRPDLRASWDRLEAMRQRRTSAWLGLAPTVSANAAAGRQYKWLTEYDDQAFWSVGAQLSVPIFQGGATMAAIEQARGAEHGAVASWNLAWLTAVREVEEALSTDVERRAAHDAAIRQEDAARLSFGESKDRYLAGLDTYLVVLTSQTALQSAELNRLQAHRDLVSARVQLHDALGGPWASNLGPQAARGDR